MSKRAYNVTTQHRGVVEEITVMADYFNFTNGMLEFFADGEIVESFTPVQVFHFSDRQVPDGQAA